jgi:hypothetical protein
MTAPRVCRACGAPLTGDVRWCLRCYEPARELTPRAAVWDPGTYVEAPIVSGPSVPHWSRWDKTPTTFGPIGRLTWTFVVVSFVLSSATRSPLLLIFELPAAAVIVRGLWARGWVVPNEATGVKPVDAIPPDSASSWLLDPTDIGQTLWLTIAGLLVMGTIMYGPPVAKFVAIAAGLVGCGWRFVRGGRV